MQLKNVIKDFSNDIKTIYDCMAYGCYLKDEKELLKSTSGGAFYALAYSCIKRGGIIYGAAMDDTFTVKHIRVDRIQDIDLLRTSKYVQSRINNTYINVKKDLDEGKDVLFSGTPCQVAGLRAFLQYEYNNLLCVDLICEGVPNNHIFKQYINYEGNKHGKIQNYCFRSKNTDWTIATVRMDSETYCKECVFDDDLYLYFFIHFANLRKSCYHCKFRGMRSKSDITIGDYWGVKKNCPEIYNPMGVSAVIIKSDKGNSAFQDSKEFLNVYPTTVAKIANNNFYLANTFGHSYARDMFFKIYKDKNHDLKETYDYIKNRIVVKKIGVIGSYSLRRVVHQLQSHTFEFTMLWHLAGQSIYSIVSDVVPQQYRFDYVFSNEYRRQMASNDYEKVLDTYLNQQEIVDYVFVDLLNEFFGVWKFNDGSVVTNNDAFQELSEHTNLKYEHILDLSIHDWERRCDKFIDIVGKYYANSSIVLIKLFLTKKFGVDGEPKQHFNDSQLIDSINDRLKIYYNYLESKYNGIRVVETDNRIDNFCFTYFEYGCREFYYNEKCYQQIADMIYKVL